MRPLTRLSTAIGDGLVAGFLGTAAMTVSSTVEARLRHRAPSTAPARATAKALGIAEFEDDVARARFNDLSHWGYGTGWGVVRGLLGASGLAPARATAAHGAAIWGSAAVTLPALDIAPPFVFRPNKVRYPCPACGLERHEPDAVHCKACGQLINIPDEGNA